MTPLPFSAASRPRVSQRFTRVALLTFASLLAAAAAAAEKTLPLWPEGGVPGYRTEKPEVLTDRRREPTVPNRSYALVSTPTLTLFPADSGSVAAPCVLVLPGGGYRNVVFDKEGTEIARWLNHLGMSAAVLKYRTLDPEKPDLPGVLAASLQDASEAMRLLRSHTAEWGIDPHRVGVIGFSAGGDLALRLTFAAPGAEAAAATRPDFVALVYPGGRAPEGAQLTGPLPPFFLVHAADDSKVPVSVSLRLFEAVQASGGRAELHVYSRGEHGFALRAGGEVRSWPELFRNWALEQGLLPAAPGR